MATPTLFTRIIWEECLMEGSESPLLSGKAGSLIGYHARDVICPSAMTWILFEQRQHIYTALNSEASVRGSGVVGYCSFVR